MYEFDIAKRPVDGKWVLWASIWTPDETLDNNPQALREYLRRTRGWRATAWQPVYVGRSHEECRRHAEYLNAR